MALIRAEQQGSRPVSQVYDGIVETAADLTALAGLPEPGSAGRRIGPGSLMFCLADGRLYAKKSDGTWGVARQ